MDNIIPQPTQDYMVVIKCYTYNHEKYIEDALKGFVIQKTDFPFCALIVDDCSTDGTANIIRSYEKKYPEIIKGIYLKENYYSQHKPKLPLIYPWLERAKYVALCEGDDYWIDSSKLQKQVAFLENHIECSLTISNGFGHREKGLRLHKLNSIPIQSSRFLTMHELLIEEGYLIPYASMCLRKEYLINKPNAFKAPLSDRSLRMWCAVNGKVFYDINPMVVYRIGSKGSFSQRIKKDTADAQRVYEGMCSFFDRFDDYTQYKYQAEVEYMKSREDFKYYLRTNDITSIKCTSVFKSLSLLKKVRILLSLRTNRLLHI